MKKVVMFMDRTNTHHAVSITILPRQKIMRRSNDLFGREADHLQPSLSYLGGAVSTRPTAAEGDGHAGEKSSAGKPINDVAVAGSPGPPGLFRSSEAVDRLTNGGKRNQCEPQRTTD